MLRHEASAICFGQILPPSEWQKPTIILCRTYYSRTLRIICILYSFPREPPHLHEWLHEFRFFLTFSTSHILHEVRRDELPWDSISVTDPPAYFGFSHSRKFRVIVLELFLIFTIDHKRHGTREVECVWPDGIHRTHHEVSEMELGMLDQSRNSTFSFLLSSEDSGTTLREDACIICYGFFSFSDFFLGKWEAWSDTLRHYFFSKK